MIKLSELIKDILVKSKKTGKKYDVKKPDPSKHDFTWDYRGSKENPNPFSKKKMKEELEPDQKEMVDGIVDMLRQVEDMGNRKEMVIDRLKDFKREGINVNAEEFVKRCGFGLTNEGHCEREPGESDEDFYQRCGNAGFYSKLLGNFGSVEKQGKRMMNKEDINNPSPKLRPEPHPTRHETEHPPIEKTAFKRLDPFKAPTKK